MLAPNLFARGAQFAVLLQLACAAKAKSAWSVERAFFGSTSNMSESPDAVGVLGGSFGLCRVKSMRAGAYLVCINSFTTTTTRPRKLPHLYMQVPREISTSASTARLRHKCAFVCGNILWIGAVAAWRNDERPRRRLYSCSGVAASAYSTALHYKFDNMLHRQNCVGHK